MTHPLYVWHDEVHIARESARLQYWRLSFVPEFDRRRIFDTLRSIYRAFGITSYIAYETFGSFDLLLRIWIPRTCDSEEFMAALETSLFPLSLWQVEYFAVGTVERHWIWNPGENTSPPTV